MSRVAAGWYNLWVLLSDDDAGNPLVLLDPDAPLVDDVGSVAHRRWRGGRALTFDGMRRGDAYVWASTRVAHAAATALLPFAPAAAGSEAAAGEATGGRSSLDVRCECRADRPHKHIEWHAH